MFLTIHIFQYLIFISQNVILKWQFKICVQAVPNCMHGVLLTISGENWMLAATLLSASEKFRPVILTTNLCVCVYMAFEVFLKWNWPKNNSFPHVQKLINGCLQFWVSTKCFLLGSARGIVIHGAKNCFLCHMYSRTCGMGSKARLLSLQTQKQGSGEIFIYCLY